MITDEQTKHYVDQLTTSERHALTKLYTPRVVEPYTPHTPHIPQQLFLMLNNREVLFGGALGGGKSDALLMAALQYVDVPGYSALLLRRTYPDLALPGAIMDRAKSWLTSTPAQMRDGGRQWVFPSGAKLTFGYLQHDKDKHRYASAEFSFIGFDELTQFEEGMYTFMFSRLRKPSIVCRNCMTNIRRSPDGTWVHTGESPCDYVYPDPTAIKEFGPAEDGTTIFDVPLRMRGATNPASIGLQWVKSRFVSPKTRVRDSIFIPSLLKDNPSLEQEEYVKGLQHLSPVERERLLHGDWDIDVTGMVFQTFWFNHVKEIPTQDMKWCRYWDMAATKDGGDYTVGALVGLGKDGRWTVADIVRGQWTPHEIEKIVRRVAINDGTSVPIRIEQEGGSSGKHIIDHYRRNILVGFNFDGSRPTGDKVTRANPVASAAEAGNFDIVEAPWNKPLLEELSLFPEGMHDDQIDALSGAFGFLSFAKRPRLLV